VRFIQAATFRYRTALQENDEAALPSLCRLVDAINLFGCLVLKYSPVIRSIEANGLDITTIGSHASLLNEFIDKSQEPLPDISPTSAVLYFDTVQNLPNIPKKYYVKMCVYLGQCLHSIATDTVTLQAAVKYLWKGVGLLIELEQYEMAGEVACELAQVLKTSDVTGAIFQYLIAQSAIAYQSRVKMLSTEFEPNNREQLFLRESVRLRTTLINPEVSGMFAASQKYFAAIPNGIHIVRLGHTMEQIKAFVTANKNFVIFIMDNMPDFDRSLTATIITFGEADKMQSVPIEINLDEMAMKYEVFKQIIATAKAPPPVDLTPTRQNSPSGKARGKGGARKPPLRGSTSIAFEPQSLSFAKQAMKLNHPEFQKFISELNESFEPVKEILAERKSEALCFISSISAAHTIPLECVDAFSEYTTIYKDFSIMAVMNRKTLLTDQPSFGNAN
jgi:hypothetical protein